MSSPDGQHETGKGANATARDRATSPRSADVDRVLVGQCLAGDDRAWEKLHRLCQPSLLRAIRLLLGSDAADVHLVDEMAARVWFALLRDDGRLLASFDCERESGLSAFLMGLARIEILRHMRAERRRRAYEFIGGRRILHEGRVPEWQMTTMMNEFRSTLSEQEVAFLERFLLDDPKADEETVVELSPANIWQRRRRLRLKLQAFLDRLD